MAGDQAKPDCRYRRSHAAAQNHRHRRHGPEDPQFAHGAASMNPLSLVAASLLLPALCSAQAAPSTRPATTRPTTQAASTQPAIGVDAEATLERLFRARP